MSRTTEERLAALEAAVEGLRAQAPINLDADQYADFVVKRSPPNWLESGGEDFTGRRLSETNAEFCDALAGFLSWQAGKDEAKNHSYVNAKGDTVFPAKFARKDAARARAFAVKLRATPRRTDAPLPAPRRQVGPAQPTFGDYGADEEIPF